MGPPILEHLLCTRCYVGRLESTDDGDTLPVLKQLTAWWTRHRNKYARAVQEKGMGEGNLEN